MPLSCKQVFLQLMDITFLLGAQTLVIRGLCTYYTLQINGAMSYKSCMTSVTVKDVVVAGPVEQVDFDRHGSFGEIVVVHFAAVASVHVLNAHANV